jgi:hypothetical protein
MKKPVITLLLLFMLAQCFGQVQRKVSLYLSAQYTETLKDRTILNNPWSMGFGAQAFLNNKTKFRPTAEITAEAFLMHVNILYLDENGNGIDGMEGMINLFAGASYHPARIIYVSCTGGPSFIDGGTYWGIKPSVGCYFSKKQRVTARVSFLNVFNRVKEQDYRAVNVAVGIKLF